MEFAHLRAVVEALEKDLTDHRRAVEALSTGAASPAGVRLVDTRIIDKPKKFHGKQGEWKDWSESFQSFCDHRHNQAAGKIRPSFVNEVCGSLLKILKSGSRSGPSDRHRLLCARGS